MRHFQQTTRVAYTLTHLTVSVLSLTLTGQQQRGRQHELRCSPAAAPPPLPPPAPPPPSQAGLRFLLPSWTIAGDYELGPRHR